MITTGLIILMVVGAVAILGFLLNEKAAGAFVSFLAVGVVAQFGFDVPIYQTIWANPMDILMYLGGFFLCGALYSIIRWRFRQDRVAGKIKALRDKIALQKFERQEQGLDDGHYRYDDDGLSEKDYLRKMRVAYNKATLTSWIAFWPLDFLILIGEEPIQRIYEWLTTRYQAISRQALEKHGLDDLKSEID